MSSPNELYYINWELWVDDLIDKWYSLALRSHTREELAATEQRIRAALREKHEQHLRDCEDLQRIWDAP